jgi:hypothetical protein
MHHRAIANELERSERRKRCDGIGIRQEPGFRQTRRDPNHVLLRYADIHETAGEPLNERFERHVSEIASEQQNAFVHCREIEQRLDEGSSHADLSSSPIAISYSRSLIGR